ncbi:MAG TPA: cytochrome b/b6 domain-containing protein [Gammaproteobacteria bacterium]|nr:cytochrome b/b6 domain-containing protein [Gammaproteobacteria bacterium]
MTMQLQEYRVWDRSQRVFHWINALAVLTLVAIGTVILNADALGVPNPGKAALKTAHVYVGYVFVLNLAWRLVWGFVGGHYARYSALLPGGRGYGRRLAAFVKGFFSGRTPVYLGHNPLARIFLSVLLLLLVVQAATGLVIAGTDVYMPPFGGTFREWAAADTHDPALVRPYAPETVNAAAYAEMRAFRAPVVTIHEYGFFALITLIAIHVAAAVIAELKEGGAIISSMFTGRKIHARRPEDAIEEGSDSAG